MTVKTDHKATGKMILPRYIFNVEDIPQLTAAEKAQLKEVSRFYPFRANEYYLSLIDWDDPADPIRRLVVPHVSELNEWGDLDACNESSITVRQGVQHKYASTVLLLVNEVCGAFCRYCFRKRMFMNDNDEAANDISEGIEYIREHKEVNNVLLTGGDPMVLPTERLEKIIAELRRIEHVKIIRIGTKMPAFYPYRFINDTKLMRLFKKYSQPDKRIYLVCHFDHPNELTPECREAIRMVQEAGVICVNQNPIIRGVSDKPSVMTELWNELSYMGVPQYYVFQGRPTAGNEPYEVPIVEAYYKIEEAKRKCSGLAKRTRYVMSHESGKIEIVGVDDHCIYLRYHRAKKSGDEQRFVVCHRDDDAFWFDQLRPVYGFDNQYFDDEPIHFAG